jgi:hypothetical protein
MALIFGRVNKQDYEHQALFANVCPVYFKGIHTEQPNICAANNVPEWFFDLVLWIACNIEMSYEGFMFSHVRPIESEDDNNN